MWIHILRKWAPRYEKRKRICKIIFQRPSWGSQSQASDKFFPSLYSRPWYSSQKVSNYFFYLNFALEVHSWNIEMAWWISHQLAEIVPKRKEMLLKNMIRMLRWGRSLSKPFKKKWLILICNFQLVVKFHLMFSQKDGTNHSAFNTLKKSMMRYISMVINVTREETIMKFMQMTELSDMWLLIQETPYKV